MNMGESYIVINLNESDEDDSRYEEMKHLDEFIDSARKNKNFTSERANSWAGRKLCLWVFGGPSTGENFAFERQPGSEQQIVIGWSERCDVWIQDWLLSKFQASITYNDEVEGWVMSDGCDGNPSTNGIWVYIDWEQEIYEGLLLKTNQTIFSCHLQS